MPYATGIDWTQPGRLDRLKELVAQGRTHPEISDILTAEFNLPVSVQAVSQVKYRYRVVRHLIPIDNKIPLYFDESIPSGNYIVFSDAHAPYYDEVYVNRLLFVADKFKVKKAVSVGDTLDMDFAKIFYDPEKSDLDTEIVRTEPLLMGLQYFDKVYFMRGNHENRIGRMTDGKIQAQHIFKLFGEKTFCEKFTYIPNTRLMIGKNWLLTHPKNYSQISGSVAVRLAEKYHRHVINAHGHFIALRYDRSGKFMGIDLGGLFKHEKVKYIHDSTTTHPQWNPGFGMIYNDKFYHFHEGTDWDFWTKT